MSSLQSLAKRATESVNREINKFADWISSYIPEKIKRPINSKIESLKAEVNKIFNRIDKFTPKESETALKGYLKTYRVEGQKGYSPKNFLISSKQKVIDLINNKKKPMKMKFTFTCSYIMENPATGEVKQSYGYFQSEVEIITTSTDLSEIFDITFEKLLEKAEKYQKEGSGWVFDYVESLDISIVPFDPLKGSSYIPTPSFIENKKAVINVKNQHDHECLKWASTAAIFPVEKNPQRLNKTMWEDAEKLDWTGINFPAGNRDIDRFEKQNGCGVCVIRYSEREGFSIHRVPKIDVDKSKIIDPLLIADEDDNTHYCWIKDISKLLSHQVTNHNGKRYFCRRCLNSFKTEKSLGLHLELCKNHEAVKVEMPTKENNIIQFQNFNRKMQAPFTIYGDWECFTEKLTTCEPSEEESYTH